MIYGVQRIPNMTSTLFLSVCLSARRFAHFLFPSMRLDWKLLSQAGVMLNTVWQLRAAALRSQT